MPRRKEWERLDALKRAALTELESAKSAVAAFYRARSLPTAAALHREVAARKAFLEAERQVDDFIGLRTGEPDAAR
jgi:hypothetical protein